MQGDEEDGVTVGPVEARRVVLCVYAPFPTQSPVSWRSAGNCDIKEDVAGRREHFRRQLRKSFVVALLFPPFLSLPFPPFSRLKSLVRRVARVGVVEVKKIGSAS